jgi:hypothetical protein
VLIVFWGILCIEKNSEDWMNWNRIEFIAGMAGSIVWRLPELCISGVWSSGFLSRRM